MLCQTPLVGNIGFEPIVIGDAADCFTILLISHIKSLSVLLRTGRLLVCERLLSVLQLHADSND